MNGQKKFEAKVPKSTRWYFTIIVTELQIKLFASVGGAHAARLVVFINKRFN